MNAKVSFHARDNRTVRRFEIIRGLVRLGHCGLLDDEAVVRGLLASVIGEVANYPAVTVGHLIGSLDATRAAVWARLCGDLADGTLVAAVHDDGRITLQPAA